MLLLPKLVPFLVQITNSVDDVIILAADFKNTRFSYFNRRTNQLADRIVKKVIIIILKVLYLAINIIFLILQKRKMNKKIKEAGTIRLYQISYHLMKIFYDYLFQATH